MNPVIARLVQRALPAAGGIRPRLGRWYGADAVAPEQSHEEAQQTFGSDAIGGEVIRGMQEAGSPTAANVKGRKRTAGVDPLPSAAAAAMPSIARTAGLASNDGAAPLHAIPSVNLVAEQTAALASGQAAEQAGKAPLIPDDLSWTPEAGQPAFLDEATTSRTGPPLSSKVAPDNEVDMTARPRANLLPPARQIAASWRGTPSPPPAAWPQEEGRPPDVHVSIGRIEILAEQARPPRLAPPPRKSAPLMPLKDYLARRRPVR